jgi:transposase
MKLVGWICAQRRVQNETLGHRSHKSDPHPPVEARSLGCTLICWKHQIAAWHLAHVSNDPTEAVNSLIKRVKRAAFGFTSFCNYRIRSLLYAGKPNWDLLATVIPR